MKRRYFSWILAGALFLAGVLSPAGIVPAVQAVMVCEEVPFNVPRYHGEMAKDPCMQDVMLLTISGSLWQYTDTGWILREATFPAGGDLYTSEYMFFFCPPEGAFMAAVQYFNPDRWRFWKYTTTGWEQLTPDFTGPAVRNNPAYFWDNNQGYLLMFGGSNYYSGLARNDTWTWDGTQWEEKTVATLPPALTRAAMVDAPNIGVVQLVGEDRGNHPGYMAVWTWDGTDWTYDAASAGVAPAHKSPTLIRDTTLQRTAMFGGYLPGHDIEMTRDLWFWDGTAWTDASSGDAPSPRIDAPGVYVNNQLVICGGEVETSGFGSICDTWTYDDTDGWIQMCAVPASTVYSKRVAITWDPVESRGLLITPAYELPLIYEWKNHAWKDLVDPLPDVFSANAIVYDPNADIFLMQAKDLSGIRHTYVHDRTAWVEQTPTQHPDAREQFPMVYHPGRQAPVIFGGLLSISYVPYMTYSVTARMFEWTGDDWAEIEMTWPKPPPMFAHAMAYDSHRGRLVVGGGTLVDNSSGPSELTPSPDVWEWDGSQWYQIHCTNYPVSTGGFPMIYDPVRRRCVLPDHEGTIWEWDGAHWHVTATGIFGATDDIFGGTVYDPASGETIIHAVNLQKTYTYADAEPETCGELGVTLDLPDTMFTPGETFYCNADICNTTGMILDGYPLFVVLDAYGELFWAPSWNDTFDSYGDIITSLPEGLLSVEVLPPFAWPDGAGSATGIGLIAAITDPEIRVLYGDFDYVTFGWTE